MGANYIEHNEKASFKLIPAEGKPHKPKKRLPSFNVFEQHMIKKDGVVVELPISRIDTKGEINTISRLGWTAPRKKRRQRRKGR